MPSRFNDAENVYDFMNSSMVRWKFRGEQQQFLPRSALEQVTTKEVIKLVLLDDAEFLINGEALEKFIVKIHDTARIIFATCFYAAGVSMHMLKALLDSGLDDTRIPLTEDACASANQKLRKRAIISFCESQKRFHTAFLHLNSMQNLNDITKPIKFDEDTSYLLGNGAFGDVWEIEIHEDHRSFFTGASSTDKFAMKVTQHAGREPQFHLAMAELTHPHLLKCLASFTFSSKYHMIYEKADDDLEKFMRARNNMTDPSSFSASDLARQLYGLAGALSMIHNQEMTTSGHDPNLLGIPQERASSRTGYIHDIKPDNILVFIYNQNGKKQYWLRLSDFSCANVRDMVESVSGQKRDSWRTENKKSTPNYRAPEYLRGEKISRPYDLWSLGCVYLELLVWFMEGYEALETFRRGRLRQVKPDNIDDEGFCYTTEKGEKATVHLREGVKQKLEHISACCTGDLRDIANIIPKLLEIDSKKRLTAGELVDQLKHLETDEKPPFEYQRPSSLGVPRMGPSTAPDYESDSDCSSFEMVKIIGATQ